MFHLLLLFDWIGIAFVLLDLQIHLRYREIVKLIIWNSLLLRKQFVFNTSFSFDIVSSKSKSRIKKHTFIEIRVSASSQYHYFIAFVNDDVFQKLRNHVKIIFRETLWLNISIFNSKVRQDHFWPKYTFVFFFFSRKKMHKLLVCLYQYVVFHITSSF